MKKPEFSVVSLRISTKTLNILRKIAFKESALQNKSVYVTDYIKLALNKYFPNVKEKLPPALEELALQETVLEEEKE